MEYYAVMGMVAACLIAVFGLSVNLKKKLKEEEKPLQELNINITKLTMAIDSMRENDIIRDKRIEKHGNEIDDLKRRATMNEARIVNLESWKNAGRKGEKE
ncbi:MAG TPA: hypothetical protein H9671_05085 [Firmicutes bacterium]|nr:hypothetical protein [Bacillota bacterium]